jgi:DNA processing protein
MEQYYLAFSQFLGIGPTNFKKLLEIFGDVKKIYEASRHDLSSVLHKKTLERFINFRNSFDPVKEYQKLDDKQIRFVHQKDSLFPQQLRDIPDPPIGLYIKGDIQKIDFAKNFFFGVVGTRQCTPYGATIARQLSTDLTLAGFTVVSGMALGIDSIAHTACLDADGQTIAFLGCGVDMVYPPSNRGLYTRILKNDGLIISEFPPGQFVLRGLFIARNRLIAGLSKGVLVIEGTRDSGSLSTARFAAEQGKDVFAIPAPLTSPYSEAPNLLLKEGAKLVTRVNDILDEYHLKIPSVPIKTIQLTQHEQQLYDIIHEFPQTADEVSMRLQISVSSVLSILTSLELKGVVGKNSETKYQIL